jgi:esterase/lipase
LIHKTNFIIENNNQLPIVGDLTFNDYNSNELVIFCHGYKGFKDWGCWNLVADKFAENGFKFLKFNFSHNGGTIENQIDFSDLDSFSKNNYSIELNDVNRVLKYISNNQKNEFNCKKTYIIGHSRGGGIAGIAGYKFNLDKIITWASVSDFSDRFPDQTELKTWKKNGVRFVENKRTNQKMPHLYQFYEDFINNSKNLDIKSSFKKFKGDILICHGTMDMAVDIKNAHNLVEWSVNPTFFKIRTNHTFGSKHPWEKSNLPNELNELCLTTFGFLNKE